MRRLVGLGGIGDWTGAVRRIGRFPIRALGLVILLGLAGQAAMSPGATPISGDVVLAGSGTAAAAPGAASAVRSGAMPAVAVSGTFAIAGSVGRLYPGGVRPLVLTVTNPQAFAIVVTSLTTTVASPAATCPGSLLAVTPFVGQLTVPARSSTQVTVSATLDHAAPDACQGITFGLAYAGQAKKA